jgi:uncharacterized membrane protein
MIAFLQNTLGPYYQYIKFIHLFFVMIWLWSTAVGFVHYLLPVIKAWRRNPDDDDIRTMRDWVMERFDHGVIYEHVAFPMILLTGPLLWIVGGWTPASGWFVMKLLIILGIYLPIEFCDYYLSHFGGNKERLRKLGDEDAYERGVQRHWMFFLVTSPPIMMFGLMVVFLAVVKPF